MGKDSKLKIDGLWIVGAFFLLALFFYSKESDSMELEIGPTNLSGEWAKGGILMFTQREGHWSFGGGYVSEQFVSTCPRPDCDNDIEPNIFFQVHRMVEYRRWELGLGPTYFQNTNRALGQRLNWGLSLGYKYGDWTLRIRHWSNAGSGAWNLGQDALTIGYTF